MLILLSIIQVHPCQLYIGLAGNTIIAANTMHVTTYSLRNTCSYLDYQTYSTYVCLGPSNGLCIERLENVLYRMHMYKGIFVERFSSFKVSFNNN